MGITSPTSSPVKSCSSPISSSSEQFEARTIIAQVHSEDAWSEDVKIAETSMNESKPEKLANGVSSQDLVIKERSHSGSTSQSASATMRRGLRNENRSRSLLQLRRSFMES